jgi:hypothetical protein
MVSGLVSVSVPLLLRARIELRQAKGVPFSASKAGIWEQRIVHGADMWNCTLQSIMRRHRLVACAAAVSAVFLLVAPGAELTAAADSYVYYLRSFGGWAVFCGAVSCGNDESSRYDGCTLSARSMEGHDAEGQIEIAPGTADTAAVTLRARSALMPESLFYLRVDNNPPHQTMPNHVGEGGWDGPEAQVILGELETGQRVVIRTFAGPPPSPRDAFFSLDGFSEAMADFGNKVGIKPTRQDVPPRMPPPPPVAAEKSEAAADGGAPAAVEPAPQESPGAAPAVLPETGGPAKQPSSAPDVTAGSSNGAVVILDEHVGRAQLTTNVVDREPVDVLGQSVRTASSGEDYVYFFTEIRNLAGQTIVHRWEHGGRVVASVSFRIGGNRWRVFSRRSIVAEQAGPWSVTAIGPGGNVLARAAFTAE